MFNLPSLLSKHKGHTFLLLTILFVAVCLSGCTNKDSRESLGIDVMAWNKKQTNS
jgi:hypothetical protein